MSLESYYSHDVISDISITEEPRLKAKVAMKGNQFIINNNDRFDYCDATLIVNDQFKCKHLTIKAGRTYSISQIKFMDDDGRFFNSSQEPVSMFIYCHDSHGRFGWYCAKWRRQVHLHSGENPL